ncbi:MAG: efflux RND transporter periplasmic adaptor subunit [Holosporales bacterium]|jgi:HlyD family secretion protein|nr:efflux RND transporter periplasmic adaptor subunit [Holosporales bacterium]
MRKVTVRAGIWTAAILCAAFISFKCFWSTPDEIVLNGNVEIHDVNVSFRISGRIGEILVEEGSKVHEDETLAVLVNDTLSAKVKLVEAQLAEAQVNLENAKKNYVRYKGLMKNKSASEKAYDTAETEYKVAIAKVESAKAAHDTAVIDLQDAKLKSPVSGVVLTRSFEKGEMVSAGVPVFSIVPNEQIRIKTFATEAVLSKIKCGDKAHVSIVSLPGKVFNGHVGFISSEAEFTPKNIETQELRATLMYRIRVLVDEPAPELKQGMPVTVRF